MGGDKRAAPLSAQADAGQKTSDTPAANVPPGKPAAAAQEGVLLNFVDADIPAVLRVLANSPASSSWSTRASRAR